MIHAQTTYNAIKPVEYSMKKNWERRSHKLLPDHKSLAKLQSIRFFPHHIFQQFSNIVVHQSHPQQINYPQAVQRRQNHVQYSETQSNNL